ncbi:MAG TPA: hypothetical protein VGN88_10555 [Phycisphaerae bacterium]|jgi:hypothetical protein
MMFGSTLRKLEAEQEREIAALRRHYRRSLRVISPRRMVQKHPMAFAVAAGLAGMWLAPAPSPVAKGANGNGKSTGTPSTGKPGIVRSLIGRLMKQFSGGGGGTEGKEAGGGAGKAPGGDSMRDGLAQLVQNANQTLQIIQVLGRMVVERIGEMKEAGSGGMEVFVGDGGVIAGDFTGVVFEFGGGDEPLATDDARNGEG